MVRTPEGCHRFSDTRSGCGDFRFLSGGLRYAATTGYYLTALQAEPTRYRSREKNVRLESALVRLARNQFTWGEMGRLRIVEW